MVALDFLAQKEIYLLFIYTWVSDKFKLRLHQNVVKISTDSDLRHLVTKFEPNRSNNSVNARERVIFLFRMFQRYRAFMEPTIDWNH